MKSPMILALIFWAQSGWSYTVSGPIYTTNGSQSDVQAACNAAPDNGTVTVVIPNGTYSWPGTLSISKALTLAGASATGVTINNNLVNGAMIAATAGSNGHINIYWLNIVQVANNGGGSGFALVTDRSEPTNYTVLVHDCTFRNGSIFTYMVTCLDNGIIFWNDTFIGDGPNDPQSLGGISFTCDKYGYTSSWNTPDTYGTQDVSGLSNTYLENCTFYDMPTACTNFDDNSRVVVRDCTVSNAQLASHGQESSAYGVREWEIYNNTFIYSSSGTGPSGNAYPLNMNAWVGIRGGSGVIFNNAMDDIPGGKNGVDLTVFSINWPTAIGCQTAYPAARQAGQGWSASSQATYGNPVVPQDGTGAVTEGVYIWGNTGSETTDPNYVGLDQYSPDGCGNGELVGNFLKQGRDYFVGTAKPGYAPYTYPHPLHTQYALSGGGSNPTPPTAAPAAPQNLRVVN